MALDAQAVEGECIWASMIGRLTMNDDARLGNEPQPSDGGGKEAVVESAHAMSEQQPTMLCDIQDQLHGNSNFERSFDTVLASLSPASRKVAIDRCRMECTRRLERLGEAEVFHGLRIRQSQRLAASLTGMSADQSRSTR